MKYVNYGPCYAGYPYPQDGKGVASGKGSHKVGLYNTLCGLGCGSETEFSSGKGNPEGVGYGYGGGLLDGTSGSTACGDGRGSCRDTK